MRFVTEAPGPAEVNGILGMKLEKADLMHLAQTVLFGLIGIVALLLVLRPMMLRIAAVAPGAIGGGGGALAALAGPGGMTAAAGAGAPSVLGGPAPLPPLLEDESMVKIAQIEGQMRASSLRRITELVEKHPEETLAIVRGWMVQESG